MAEFEAEAPLAGSHCNAPLPAEFSDAYHRLPRAVRDRLNVCPSRAGSQTASLCHQ
jgi:hypothetical protein